MARTWPTPGSAPLAIDGSIVALCLLAAFIVRTVYRIPVEGSQKERSAGDF